MGEAKQKRVAQQGVNEKIKSAGVVVDDLMMPTRLLRYFEEQWPNVWRVMERTKHHFESSAGLRPSKWCELPVDFAIAGLDMLQRDGRPRGRPLMSLDHDGAIASALVAWRLGRNVHVFEGEAFGDWAKTRERLPANGEAFLRMGSKAVYCVTPGLTLKMGECVGVLASLDDRIMKDGSRISPMLQLVCMVKAVKGAEGLIGQGVAKHLGVVPMPLPIPLAAGDLKEEYIAENASKLNWPVAGLDPIAGALEVNALFLKKIQEFGLEALDEESRAKYQEVMAAPKDRAGMLRYLGAQAFEEAAQVASIVWAAISGEYETTLAAAMDSPFGEVRVVGARKVSTAGVDVDQGYGETEANVGATSNEQMTWRTSGAAVDIEGLVANAPWVIDGAKLAFLHHNEHGFGVVLPRADVAVEDVRSFVAKWFEDVDLQVASPQGFGSLVRSLGDESTSSFDSMMRLPEAEGQRWVLALMATDSSAQYVSAERVLHTLGEYAMLSGSGIPRRSRSMNDVECFYEAAALVWQLGRVRRKYQDINGMPKQAVRMVMGYFGAYVLAHFMGMDPRIVSYGVLLEERRDPDLTGMLAGYMLDLRYIVAFSKGLGSFLEHHAGLTKSAWEEGNCDDRARMVAKGATALLRYQDECMVGNRRAAGGGIRWLPVDFFESARGKRNEVAKDDPLLGMMRVVYDSMGVFLQKALRAGELPTILTAFVTRNGNLDVGETYVPMMQGGSEEDFIGRNLAKLECLFVLRQSEAWIRTGGKRSEGAVFRFLARDFDAHGVYEFTRAPFSLRKQSLVVAGSPEDMCIINAGNRT